MKAGGSFNGEVESGKVKIRLENAYSHGDSGARYRIIQPGRII